MWGTTLAREHGLDPNRKQRTWCGRDARSVLVAKSQKLVTCGSCGRVLAARVEIKRGERPGIELFEDAIVLFGSPYFCTAPATIKVETVAAHTPEGKIIAKERVRPGSARYRLLRLSMFRGLRSKAAKILRGQTVDCVVGAGGIADARGWPVKNVTKVFVKALR